MDQQVIIQVKNNKANFKKFNPQFFSIKGEGLDVNKDENYEHQGAFKLDAFLGTKRPLTPTYNINTQRWGFKGDATTLRELVSKCKLRHERGDKKGQIIEPEEVDVTNRFDPFFDHSEMFIRLEDGKAKLNLNDPKSKFLYLCLSEDPNITNPSAGLNPFVAAGQKFEIININEENAKILDNVEDKVEAMTLFGAIANNSSKLIAVSRALGIIRDDSKPEDESALKLELMRRWVENVAPYPNSNKSYQKVFIETAEKDMESLNRMWLVHFGLFKSVLRKKMFDGFWTMKTKDGGNKELIGVKSELDAYNYFSNPDNYGDLESLYNQTNAFNSVS